MTPVRWTDQAAEDLKAIREFIGRDSLRYSRLVAERLFDATQRLEVFPLSGRVVPELGRDDIREIILGEYRIVYRLKGETELIVTIFRSSRLFPTALADL